MKEVLSKAVVAKKPKPKSIKAPTAKVKRSAVPKKKVEKSAKKAIKTVVKKNTIKRKVGAVSIKDKTIKKQSVRTKSAVKLNTSATIKKTATPNPKSTESNVLLRPKKAVVVLPDRMSIRAREKVLVLAEHFEGSFQKFAYPFTMGAGLAFVLFGSFATFSLGSPSTICSLGGCEAQLLSAAVDEYQAEPVELDPKLELVTDLPHVITQDTRLVFVTEDIGSIQVHLLYQNATGNTAQHELQVADLGNGKFEASVILSALQPNTYKIRVRAWPPAKVQYETYTVGNFVIEGTPDVTNQAETTSSDAVTQTTSATTQVEGEVQEVEETPAAVTTTNSIDEEESTIALEENTPSEEAPAEVVPKLQLNFNKIVSGNAVVSLVSNFTLKSGTVAIRQVLSSDKALLIPLEAGQKTFFIHSGSLVNGSYTLKLLARSDDGAQVEVNEKFTVSNELPAVKPSPTSVTTENPEREVFEREEVTTDSEDQDQAEQTISVETSITNLQAKVRERFAQTPAELDALLLRYAVAMQSGDLDLIREAKRALINYKQALVNEALADNTDKYIAEDIATQLDVEFARLENKVETFEKVRRDREGGKSAVDSDGDGITDIDELVLFKSDPLRADTDGDGFTDGAEIIKGFNPNDASAEATLTYRSPKETLGIAANQNLLVQEVSAEIDVTQEQPTVHATVRGKALRNSFVTLYVFSTPTVVTVRTDDDGLFEYTFANELEDGEHQVFVALTDNTGDIVAQSAPYTFVKRAEAFTPVDAEAAGAVDVLAPATSDTSPYRTVLSMSVLALGVLLILLGVGLRANRPDELVVITETT